jgi:hypothetical protein
LPVYMIIKSSIVKFDFSDHLSLDQYGTRVSAPCSLMYCHVNVPALGIVNANLASRILAMR